MHVSNNLAATVNWAIDLMGFVDDCRERRDGHSYCGPSDA